MHPALLRLHHDLDIGDHVDRRLVQAAFGIVRAGRDGAIEEDGLPLALHRITHNWAPGLVCHADRRRRGDHDLWCHYAGRRIHLEARSAEWQIDNPA